MFCISLKNIWSLFTEKNYQVDKTIKRQNWKIRLIFLKTIKMKVLKAIGKEVKSFIGFVKIPFH